MYAMSGSCFRMLALGFLFSGSASGELKVSRIFSEGAVLQRGAEVPVWGTADAGEKVTVDFSGQRLTVDVDQDGKWQVTLKPLTAQPAGKTLTVRSGDESLEIRDLLVGEVWYASGQSNMQWTVGACAKKIAQIDALMKEPASRSIRMVRLGNPDTPKPLADLPSPVEWKKDLPENRAKQSAVAWFFARALHDELKVPIGIIEGSWGGKPIEGFIPRDEFGKHPELKPILELSDANELEKLKEIEGGVIIRNTAGRPGRIFHSRVAPVAPFAIKGFIWYQGESNAGRGEDPRNYRLKMEALVEGWRDAWGSDELPFYYVQLPSFKDSATGWVRLREEQRLALKVPKTGMAVTIDLLDHDIHPANKFDVGNRLARWALAGSYGKEMVYSGPLFQSATTEGGKVRVSFDHVGEGLMVARKEGLQAPVAVRDGQVGSFELADQEGKWHPAEARIAGKEVVVSSKSVPNPMAVRYACEGEAEKANLYNRAGLPASPFCSDPKLLPWVGR
ncbi:MAG: sialate O-acetylesterase [Akkermansiaceae bacterium]